MHHSNIKITDDEVTTLYKAYKKNNPNPLYIGISAFFNKRNYQHSKYSEWHKSCDYITLQRYPTRSAALKAERQAIIKEKPKFNIVHNKNYFDENLRTSMNEVFVSKSEAAKLAGKSRTTIHTYINNGKLSDINGKIETSELVKVFGEPQIVQSERDFTPDQTARIRDLENQLDEVRQDRDSWREQAQSSQRLLEYNASKYSATSFDKLTLIGIFGCTLLVLFFIAISA